MPSNKERAQLGFRLSWAKSCWESAQASALAHGFGHPCYCFKRLARLNPEKLQGGPDGSPRLLEAVQVYLAAGLAVSFPTPTLKTQGCRRQLPTDLYGWIISSTDTREQVVCKEQGFLFPPVQVQPNQSGS